MHVRQLVCEASNLTGWQMSYLMPVRHPRFDCLWIAAQELDRCPIMNGRVWNVTKSTSSHSTQNGAQAGVDPTQQQLSVLLFKKQTVGSRRSVMLQVQDKGVVDIAQ
jgi:hypothetical protein